VTDSSQYPRFSPTRPHAYIRVDLTEREARSLACAATLVADVLRPELFVRDGSVSESPLITAYQVVVAACERAGVDLGIGARRTERPPFSELSPEPPSLAR
jgi:hypothetical protein